MCENSYYIRINGDGGKILKFADKMQETNICLYVCRFLDLDKAKSPSLSFFNIVQRVLNTDTFIHFATACDLRDLPLERIY